MGTVRQKQRTSVVIVSVAFSLLGMEVDVCSGPLPPEQGLRFACALVLGISSEEDRPALQASTLSGCSHPARRGSVALSVADWPAPVLVVKCRQPVARNSALAPRAFETPRYSALPSLAPRAAHGLAPVAEPIDQLCRLDC